MNLTQARDEFQTNSNELTVDKLIDAVVQSKTTGTEKPGICIVMSVCFMFVFVSFCGDDRGKRSCFRNDTQKSLTLSSVQFMSYIYIAPL